MSHAATWNFNQCVEEAKEWVGNVSGIYGLPNAVSKAHLFVRFSNPHSEVWSASAITQLNTVRRLLNSQKLRQERLVGPGFPPSTMRRGACEVS